jgi:hypothetical protein
VTSGDLRRPADRVWASLPRGAQSVLAAGLSPTDLQTLLLDLARTRSRQVDAARLRRRWTDDRFVQPAPVDPRRLSGLVARAWELLPSEFAGVELSPVTPLGTCSAVAPVDQNRIVSTARGSEVISDPTNVLALEADRRRRSTRADVHLAAHQRVLQAQHFPPGWSAHFALLALVSSGRDRGSSVTELDFLRRHLTAWRTLLDETLGRGRCWIDYATFGDRVLSERISDRLVPDFPELRPAQEPMQGSGYYTSLRFKVMARTADGQLEIGDGGLTDWTAQLAADAKERCLISCVATERWLQLSDEGS